MNLLMTYWYVGIGPPFTDVPTLPDQASALRTLIHEAVHASGDHNEGSTECRAIRGFADVARSVGVVDVPAFSALAERSHAALPPEYRTVC